MDLLTALTDDLNNTLPALLIGNIITSVLFNKPTNLKKFQVTHQLTGLSDVLASTFAVVLAKDALDLC